MLTQKQTAEWARILDERFMATSAWFAARTAYRKAVTGTYKAVSKFEAAKKAWVLAEAKWEAACDRLNTYGIVK